MPYGTAHNSKAIFTKLYTQVGTGSGPGKNWLNFGSHLRLASDPALFDGIFNIARKDFQTVYVLKATGSRSCATGAIYG